jgi:hypothetical protein
MARPSQADKNSDARGRAGHGGTAAGGLRRALENQNTRIYQEALR